MKTELKFFRLLRHIARRVLQYVRKDSLLFRIAKRIVSLFLGLLNKTRRFFHYVRMELSLLSMVTRATPLSTSEVIQLDHIEHLCKKRRFRLFTVLTRISTAVFALLIPLNLIFIIPTLASSILMLYCLILDDNIRDMITKKYNNYKENKEQGDLMVKAFIDGVNKKTTS